MLEELKIKQHFTSVEHPHTNEKEETTNWMLLRGFEMKTWSVRSGM